MAEAKMTIQISLEKMIHKGIQEFAQQLWDDQKILISNVDIHWLDISRQGQPNFTVQNVIIITQTVVDVRPEGLL